MEDHRRLRNSDRQGGVTKLSATFCRGTGPRLASPSATCRCERDAETVGAGWPDRDAMFEKL